MFLVATTVLALLSPRFTVEPEQGEPVKVSTYILEGGNHYQGQVISVEGERVRFRVPVEGGSYDEWRKLSNFIPHCAFRIKKKVSDDASAEAHLQLAKYATEKGLVYFAVRELEYAREIGADAAVTGELEALIERRGAGILAELFEAALTEGDVKRARKVLSDLMIKYPGTEAASGSGAMLERLEAAEEQAERQQLAQLEEERKAAEVKARERAIEPYKRLLSEARKHNRDGLLSSRSLSKGLGHFKASILRYERLIRGVDDKLAKSQDDAWMVESLSGLSKTASSELIGVLLNSGSMCLVRGQYTQALGYVNRILATDQGNRDALAMRARIEIAANQDGFGL